MPTDKDYRPLVSECIQGCISGEYDLEECLRRIYDVLYEVIQKECEYE